MVSKLSKSIITLLLSFCFLTSGLLILRETESIASATTNIVDDASDTYSVNNNVPSYFSAIEYTTTSKTDTNSSSLIDDDILLFNESATGSNFLEISLVTNGSTVNTDSADVYDYVYYPDTTDLTTFYFYNITSVNLAINGESKDLETGTVYTTSSGKYFENLDNVSPETFKIGFAKKTDDEKNSADYNYIYDLVNSDGDLVEGRYTLTIVLNLTTCTGGLKTGLEEQATFSDTDVTITYEFFVVSQSDYYNNTRPILTASNFDSTTEVSTSLSTSYGYYYYSNFSTYSNGSAIASITYDASKYDIEVSRSLNDATTTETLTYVAEYDVENNNNDGMTLSGEEFVVYEKSYGSSQVTLYFYDIGNYSISFTAVATFTYKMNETTVNNKYTLSALSSRIRSVMVYVYGYDATYVDYDNDKTDTSFKTIDYNTDGTLSGTFSSSADITAAFLNSSDSYSQNKAKDDTIGNSTFQIGNILSYIENANDGAGLSAQVTNQAPVRFASNATMLTGTVSSYVYSTATINSSSTTTNNYLEIDGVETQLYKTTYTGGSLNEIGTYIVILAYYFEAYYTPSGTKGSQDVYFYQVFYFEIENTSPEITLNTAEDGTGTSIYSNTYTNQSVYIIDNNSSNDHSKSVTVRIYAYDYVNGQYLSDFGGTSGKSLSSLTSDGVYQLSASAHYTIRLYYTYEITTASLNISNSSSLIKREYYFTIDKVGVDGITATNVELGSGTTYNVVSTVSGISTNQSIAISWNEKASGAQTYAYYRYFSIGQYSFYDESDLQDTLRKMLNGTNTTNSIAVNYSLDLSTTSSTWLKYAGNTLSMSKISSGYVLSSTGLYIIDVYDEAGNHAVEIYIIDTTTPNFVLYNGSYSLVSGTTYISQDSTLYWGDYKTLYIQNMPTVNNKALTSIASAESVTTDDLSSSAFFNDYYGNSSLDIFTAFYSLYSTMHIQYITYGSSNTTSPFLAFKIDDTFYDIDVTDTSSVSDTYQINLNSSISSIELTTTDGNEYTYRILIRDESNTVYDSSSSTTAQVQYTSHYSAMQTIIVSFDTSEFRIYYETDNGNNYFSSNNTVISDDGSTLETYLTPTSIEKAFYVSYIPTVSAGNDTYVQIDTITLEYYPYEQTSESVNGVTYYYYHLSTSATSSTTIYSLEDDGTSTSSQYKEIMLNSNDITTAGKYVITRTYKTGDGYTTTENDYTTRIFYLYVDRNEVISSPVSITENNTTHSESLIGGDIFVSMYDSKDSASIVVSYPNVTEGNTDSLSLYNSSNSTASSFTTNKLPVGIYVPMFKYTKYTSMNVDTEDDSYDYTVTADSTSNKYTDTQNITEYVMFAEIYKDYVGSGSVALYRTTSNFSNPTSSNITYDEDTGYLVFYNSSGNKLSYLTEEGVYTVIIYQGYSSTDFKKYTMFTFTIEDTTPDFTARTTSGVSLNYTTTSGMQYYYTNQDTIQLLWAKSKTDYLAEIDQSTITVSIRGGSETIYSAEDLFSSISTSGNYYVGVLNLRNLGVYQNGYYITITMQYENASYYGDHGTVTKRICVDLEAPNTNITNLVQTAISNTYLSNLITTSDLRTYYNINKSTVSSLTETCYNVSTSSGTYRYYSYSVYANFVSTLASTSSSEVSAIYYREMTNKYDASSSDQETEPYTFNSTNFSKISSSTSLEAGKYYEIVETDLAGNLTIYTIYILTYSNVDDSEDVTINNIITYTNTDGDSVSYTRSDYLNVENTTSHTPLHNIYTKTGAIITDINYFGYGWTVFSVNAVTTSGLLATYYYVSSPWLADGYVYYYDGSSYTEVKVSTIIDTSLSTNIKNVITFYDNALNGTKKIYINTRNTTFTGTTTSVQTEEYITFTQPTDAELESTTYAQTFLTAIKIYIPDENTVLYEAENVLGYANLWASGTYVTVTTSTSAITFTLNSSLNLTNNKKIVYEYTDNYGSTYTEIHLFNETTGYKEISAENTLYSFYYTLDGETNLYYITQNGFKYTYNTSKYSIINYTFNGSNWVEVDTEAEDTTVQIATSQYGSYSTVRVCTYTTTATSNYSNFYKIEVYQEDDETATGLVKTVYFILNDELPTVATTMTNLNNNFYFASNGVNVTDALLGLDDTTQVSYFSKTTLYYNISTTLLPVKMYISTDGVNFEEITTGTTLSCDEDVTSTTYYLKIWYDLDAIAELGYTNQNSSTYSYIFEYIPSSYVYEFTLTSTLATAYYLLLSDDYGNATIVEKSGSSYSNNGNEYSNHYIVNVNYSSRDIYLQIVTNSEQYITASEVTTYTDDTGNTDNDVHTVIYKISNEEYIAENSTTNVPRFSTTIAVTFIEEADQIVSGFYTFNTSGTIDTSNNLISSSSLDFVVDESSSLSTIKLYWSKYYAIKQNTINITITKNGTALSPTIYSETISGSEYYYIYLTRSGKYKISFTDVSGNSQVFNKGNTSQTSTFTLTFIKDIPFTITYVNPLTSEEETTEPITQAVYNGSVTIDIDSETSSYYTATGVSIVITKDGEEYLTQSGFTTCTLDETGYYSITLSATASSDSSTIRTETYYITIMNANEYRYSYIINKYSNYYIERIVKDGVDVTSTYVNELDLSTITVNSVTYLAELTLSYLDEKTGDGIYYITINSNEKLYSSDLAKTSWTFKIIIKVGSANLIYVTANSKELTSGDATTAEIVITFNPVNIYEEFGECTLRVIYYNSNNVMAYYTSNKESAVYTIDETTTDVITLSIDDDNTTEAVTYFIQLVSPSGNLLYSMKVVRSKAMNAATIIVIVVAVLVLIAGVFIIFRLRKRISVK